MTFPSAPAPVSLWAQGWLVSVQSSAKSCVGHTRALTPWSLH